MKIEIVGFDCITRAVTVKVGEKTEYGEAHPPYLANGHGRIVEITISSHHRSPPYRLPVPVGDIKAGKTYSHIKHVRTEK